MLSMIWAHPHATWYSGQGRVYTVHVKCQWAEVTMNKLANQITPAEQ